MSTRSLPARSAPARCAPDRDDVIFSVEDGIVRASWPGTSEAVELGSYYAVVFIMRDFLAQYDLGERLAGRGGERN